MFDWITHEWVNTILLVVVAVLHFFQPLINQKVIDADKRASEDNEENRKVLKNLKRYLHNYGEYVELAARAGEANQVYGQTSYALWWDASYAKRVKTEWEECETKYKEFSILLTDIQPDISEDLREKVSRVLAQGRAIMAIAVGSYANIKMSDDSVISKRQYIDRRVKELKDNCFKIIQEYINPIIE